jgi:hypothetical protein
MPPLSRSGVHPGIKKGRELGWRPKSREETPKQGICVVPTGPKNAGAILPPLVCACAEERRTGTTP